MCKVILPFHYRVFRCLAGKWVYFKPTVVYSLNGKKIDAEDISCFGLTLGQIRIELFRINGGRDGFYLGNLHDRAYYYCGLEAEDVPPKLKELGIIAVDPFE